MLRRASLEALVQADVALKLERVAELSADWAIEPHAPNPTGLQLPGRPARPDLVQADQLPKRPVGSLAGRGALLHALAHIEFNAINLALDAVWRFDGMPAAYYTDWLRVAKEEAHHFALLAAHLQTLGVSYGDLPAHDGLWEMAQRTQDDVVARMALVPRTLEARGLDASPAIREKLEKAGDHDAARILDIILRDEVGHVRIGNHWFRHLCELRGQDPLDAYAALAKAYRAPRLRGPFNRTARLAAGFDDAELHALEAAALLKSGHAVLP